MNAPTPNNPTPTTAAAGAPAHPPTSAPPGTGTPSSDMDRRRVRLLDPDMSVGLQAATEIRENIEIVHNPTTFPAFLSSNLPVFLTVLSRRTRPNPDPESTESKLRKTVLDLLARLPHNEILRPHAPQILTTAMTVLCGDYEENAMVASRIVFEVHKNYRPTLGEHVQPFLDFVVGAYRQLPASVQRNFAFVLQQQVQHQHHQMGMKAAGAGGVTPPKPPPPPPPVPMPPKPPATGGGAGDAGGSDVTTPVGAPTPLPKTAPATDPSAAAAVANEQKKKAAATTGPPLEDTTSPSTTAAGHEAAPASKLAGVATTTGGTAESAAPPPPPPPSSSAAAAAAAAATNAANAAAATAMRIGLNLKSISSFRVLTECPLTVILLFQHYPKFMATNIPTLIPLMIEALALRQPPLHPYSGTGGGGGRGGQDQQQHQQQQQMHRQHAYVTRTRELVACQVKTLSFLTYLLRGFTEQMKRYEDRIASNVVSLLTSCPTDAVATRKELLVATRHILATPFRRGFFPHVDSLLDGRVVAPAVTTTGVGGGGGGGTAPNNRPQMRGVVDRHYAVALAPLSYSTLADFVHHVRARLTLAQHSRVVHVFGRVVHDPSLPVTIQTTSVRLLLNLVDNIYHHGGGDNNNGGGGGSATTTGGGGGGNVPRGAGVGRPLGRDLLVRILHALVSKFETLRDYIDVVRSEEEEGGNVDEKKGEGPISSSSEERRRLIRRQRALIRGRVETSDTSSDIRALLKPMIVGIKTVIWCVVNYHRSSNNPNAAGVNAPTPKNSEQGNKKGDVAASKMKASKSDTAADTAGTAASPQRLSSVEIELLENYVEWAVPCLRVFRVRDDDEGGGTSESSEAEQGKEKRQQEYQEILESFAASLTVIDGYNLRKIISSKLPMLYNAMNQDDNMLLLPRHWMISSKSSSFHVCDATIGFLLDKMKSEPSSAAEIMIVTTMGASRETSEQRPSPDGQDFRVTKESRPTPPPVFTLFNIVFQSISLYPENETVLRPHLQTLVAMCLQSGGKARHHTPGGDHYYDLLRTLFRTVSGGKFEQSYVELLPLLPTILNGLYRVHVCTDDEALRGTICELCLTIPARLSSLLPHLPLLLRLIVSALRSQNGDLINLGLRTLEFWIDNLNPEYLYPILCKKTNVLTDVMTSLCTHLRPAPYPYGLLTSRLLGKLGGKNRLFLREPIDLDHRKELGGSIPNVMDLRCAWSIDHHVQEGDGDEAGARGHDSAQTPQLGNTRAPSRRTSEFSIPLDQSVQAAVSVLKRVVNAQVLSSKGASSPSTVPEDEEINEFTNEDFANTAKINLKDLTDHSNIVKEMTARHQSKSALTLLRTALASMVDMDDIQDGMAVVATIPSPPQSDSWKGDEDKPAEQLGFDQSSKRRPTNAGAVSPHHRLAADRMVEYIILGIAYATLIDELRDEAMVLLRGLGSHMLLIIASHTDEVRRVDANGNFTRDYAFEGSAGDKDSGSGSGTSTPAPAAEATSPQAAATDAVGGGKMQPMKPPFGCFHFLGPLRNGASPFAFNSALVELLCQGSNINGGGTTRAVALRCIEHLVCTARNVDEKAAAAVGKVGTTVGAGCGDKFFENLLHLLCQSLHSRPWNRRSGPCDGILFLCKELGVTWARRYEHYLMQSAIYVVKDSPREIACASREALTFLIRVFTFLYGIPPPALEKDAPDFTVDDTLAVPDESVSERKADPIPNPTGNDSSRKSSGVEPNRAIDVAAEMDLPVSVTQMLVGELNASKGVVRFGIRHCLLHLSAVKGCPLERIFGKSTVVLKRLLFSRPLRAIPLREQVAVIEALAFVVDTAPSLFPLTNQDVLALLSELLKMTAIADGVMTAKEGDTFALVDKDGNVSGAGLQNKGSTSHIHASAIFLSEQYTIDAKETGGVRVVVPADLPSGVQLRVSSLLLFKAIIRRYTKTFFEAPQNNPIGNIRPHVISLLFRSLVSKPPQAVNASYAALRDVLSLGVSEPAKSPTLSNRLPKELLQTCIRPVLLNLRDYAKLTIPLLRGLSRLLSLLASWFNKTLGEKLLEHLKKWEDPDSIVSKKIWRPGEEPLIAAAVVGLFELLPQAPHFVENLFTEIVKLEEVLPGYKSFPAVASPYRAPLARYCNRHPGAVVDFFLSDRRLREPAFCELFQSILARDDATDLRRYVSGESATRKLLSVCFERPLAVIRSEKSAGSSQGGRSAAEILAFHGIPHTTLQKQKEILLRLEAESCEQKLRAALEVEKKTKEALKVASDTQSLGDKASEPEVLSAAAGQQASIQTAKHQTLMAQKSREKCQQELNDAKKALASAIAAKQGSTAQKANAGMTAHTLELQFQGCRIVQTLIVNDSEYLKAKHHQDIIKTFRWLWHSKGRHLRLVHEEALPPHYQNESKLIAKVLIAYAKTHPSDVDVLFDLLRIFLERSCVDFSFVRRFLEITVGKMLSTDDRKRVLNRYFNILSSERPEETKILSIQYLVLPMLLANFERSHGSQGSTKIGQSPSRNSWASELKHQQKQMPGNIPVNENIDKDQVASRPPSDFVDAALLQKFVSETLSQGATCGNRLQVELLKVLTVLIEFRWEDLMDHRKDLIKHTWNMLKSEEHMSKNWAYINVCRFISAYETPSKLIFQVQSSLLKAYQPESRDMVRTALDILVPALSARLTKNEFDAAMRDMKKIMYEESSTPQLMHTMHVIVRHQEDFFFHRGFFSMQIVSSLNRLGLPPNCPLENRELSISLTEVILSWEDRKDALFQKTEEQDTTELDTGSRKRVRLNEGAASKKRLKDNEGTRVDTSASTSVRNFSLSNAMVNVVVNFLIRLALLTADAKDEHNQRMRQRAIALFRRALKRWSDYVIIDSAPFEKVFASCLESGLPTASATPYKDKKSKDKQLKGKGGTKPSKATELGGAKAAGKKSGKAAADGTTTAAASKEEHKAITVGLVSTCLDLFNILLQSAPENTFFESNVSKLSAFLIPSFAYAVDVENVRIRSLLKIFLVLVLSRKTYSKALIDCKFIQKVKWLLETTVVNSEDSDSGGGSPQSALQTSPGTMNDKSAKTKVSSEGSQNSSNPCSASFVVEILEKVQESGKLDFVDNFSSCLLGLARDLTRDHVHRVSSSTRGTMSQMGGSVLATPVIGVMEEACGRSDCTSFSDTSTDKGKASDDAIDKSSDIVGTLAACVRLLGASSLPFSFSQQRKDFFEVLSNILDTSDEIYLLITTVRVVGKWLLSRGGGPMTLKERNSFIWKMTTFDGRGLPEVAAQPLVDMISRIVLSLHDLNAVMEIKGCGTTGTAQTKARSVDVAKKNATRNGGSVQGPNADMLISRSLVAGLLSANSRYRSLMIGVFGTQSKQRSHVVHDELLAHGVKIGCSSNSSVDAAGIPGRTPLDVLWQLLYSDWEALGNRFWIVAFVDIMIAVTHHEGGVQLRNSHTVAATENSGAYERGTIGDSCSTVAPAKLLQKPRIVANNDKDTSISAKDVDSTYSQFCEALNFDKADSSAGRGRCLAALRSLAHGDVDLSQSLFEILLRAAWLCMENHTRLALLPAVEALLSRPYHSQFLVRTKCLSGVTSGSVHQTPPHGINCIQASLRALLKLRPIPILDIDLLLSLAGNFNAWHEVMTFFENQYTAEGTAVDSRLVSALCRCYQDLGEDDISLGLRFQHSVCPGTKKAITLDMYGLVSDALAQYSSLVDQVDDLQQKFGASIEAQDHFVGEMALWEERWIDLNREMCQWAVLSDYAKASESPLLTIENAWKSRDWEALRAMCSAPSIVATLEAGDPRQKMNEIFLAIADGKLNEVENLHAQTSQLCLYKWQLTPGLSTACNAHNLLFQSFHRLVELRESGQIMVETSTHSKNRTFPDLKNLLTAWRERVPNSFDKLSVWEDLLIWRSHMFSAITTNFQWSDPSSLASLHDRPWTAIQMARIARKQGLKEVALLSLSKLTDCAMDVSDAFSKLREQIMIYRDSEDPGELRGGLNLVNTTNLSFFDAAQKSELFRLKASFLNSLGGRAKSNQAYCQSLQICHSYSKSWLSWGELCSSLATLTERQALSPSSTGGTDGTTNSAAANEKKAVQYLAQALGCYLEGVNCGANEWARIHLPRCLWMLRKDGHSPGLLCQTFEARGVRIPEWVWLPWIPQLLSSLGRTEASAAKAVLKRIVAKYPQALYFALRAYYLERRDVERANRAGSSGQQRMTAVSHAEELMSSLRRSHSQLWTSLEAILEELIVRFRPSLEEELLATIKALLQRATSQLEQSRRGTVESGVGAAAGSSSSAVGMDQVLSNFTKTLSRISQKFFRPPTVSGKDVVVAFSDDRAKRVAEFNLRYKGPFQRDFLDGDMPRSKTEESRTPSASLPPPQTSVLLSTIIERLEKWKDLLEEQISVTPCSFPLHQVSPSLATISTEAPDLWTGACDPRPSGSNGNGLVTECDAVPQSPSSSAAAACAAAISASAAVASAAAAEGVGGYYGGGSAAVEIPGQYAPYSTNSLDTKPSPELNAKLVRFESNVEVMRRSEGQQLVRRIGMLGSDGKTHYFLLQFAVSYLTRTDEHTAQINYLLDKLLRQGIQSSRRSLSVRANTVVPIAQRLRMTADDPDCNSLDEVFRLDRDSRELSSDAPSSFFKEEVARRMDERKTSRELSESSIKLEVFNEVCQKMVDPNIVLRRMQAVADAPEDLFAFRKAFAGQLAANSLLQYAFNVTDRTPSKFVFNIRNAQLVASDFRLGYNNQGLLEGNKIPFRLTRNIETLLGPFVLNGAFIPSMASIAAAVSSRSRDIDAALCLLLRDDIVAWYTSKSTARSDAKNQELERQLGERIIKNASLVQGRVKDCAPAANVCADVATKISNEEEAADALKPIDFKLRKLIATATSPDELCMTPTVFQPWL